MPRVKIAGQIDALNRQQTELLAKLKETRSKANAKKREAEDRRALTAGRAVIRELDEKPEGAISRAILAVLGARLSRREDRAAFNLPPLLAKAAPETSPPPAVEVEAPRAAAPPVIEPARPQPAPAPEAARGAPAESSVSGFLGNLAARVIHRPKQA